MATCLNTPRQILSEGIAAVMIQRFTRRVMRGYQVRKSFLPREFFHKYQRVCKELSSPEKQAITRKAHGGKTTVYLPEELPDLVLKSTGRQNAVQRFDQMRKVRAILDRRRCKHLIVPKARNCAGFLVEERLPVLADQTLNMGLYLENTALFTPAVKEMVRLFATIRFSGLVQRVENPVISPYVAFDIIRYDNLPFFIKTICSQQTACIGLIDLERTEVRLLSPLEIKHQMETLARIFPIHLREIIEEAERLNIPYERRVLAEKALKGIKYLKKGYTEHLEWLYKKTIFSWNSFTKLKISDTSQIHEELKKVLEDEGECVPCIDFKELLELIKLNLENHITYHQLKKLSDLGRNPESEKELVLFRSALFAMESLQEPVTQFLLSIFPPLSNKDVIIKKLSRISKKLIEATIHSLKNSNVIYSYSLGSSPSGEFVWMQI